MLGFSLSLVGEILIFALLVWFTIDRFQNEAKAWYLFTLPLLSIVFVGLTQLSNRTAKIVFSWLSLFFPLLVLICFGSLLLALAIFQGFNSISWIVYALVLCSLLALAGSVLLIWSSKNRA